jgi:hypothetical protein
MQSSKLQLTITQLSGDPKISARIFLQYCEIKDAIWPDKPDEAEMFDVLKSVMKKLESVAYHRNNIFKIIEQTAKSTPPEMALQNRDHFVQDYSTGIDKEFEAFLMQGKSYLDVLAKLLRPLFKINLHSFGESGESVINALRNNVPGAKDNPRVERVIKLIQDDQEWIKRWFKSERDTISHYRWLEHTGLVFAPVEGDGPRKVLLPVLPDGTPLHIIADAMLENLLSFAEDLVCLLCSVKFVPGIDLALIPEEERDKEHPRKFRLGSVPGFFPKE